MDCQEKKNFLRHSPKEKIASNFAEKDEVRHFIQYKYYCSNIF
jgi:hypothetical protein